MVRVLVPYRAVSCGCIRAAHECGGKAARAHNRRRASGCATAGLREASPAPRRMPCRAVAVGAHGPVGHSAAATLRCWVCIQVWEAVCLFASRSGKLFVCLYPGRGTCLFVCIQVREAVCLFVSRSGKLFVCLYPGQGSCPSMSLSRTSAHRRVRVHSRGCVQKPCVGLWRAGAS